MELNRVCSSLFFETRAKMISSRKKTKSTDQPAGFAQLGPTVLLGISSLVWVWEAKSEAKTRAEV